MRLPARLLVVAAALALAACGGGSDGGSIGGALPECAQAEVEGKKAELPQELPAGFPLPPGLVLTFASTAEGQLALNGFAPGDVGAVGKFFERELPKHGYTVGRGDAEEFEKEAPFTGNGFRGHWRVFGSPACETAVRVFVLLIRQS